MLTMWFGAKVLLQLIYTAFIEILDQQKIPENVSILKYERVKLSKTRHALIVKNCNYSDFGTYQAQSGQDVRNCCWL